MPAKRQRKSTKRAEQLKRPDVALPREGDRSSGVNQNDRWRFQVCVVFIVAVLLRVIHFLSMSQTAIYDVLIGDAWQYDRWGRSIAEGQWIGTTVFYQTPLYPYLLDVLYFIFGHSVWIARGVQALMSGVACVLLARTGTRLFDSRVGWVSGLLLAAYPPAIFFDGILQKASLDLVLVCALLWLISRIQQRQTLWTVLGLGMVLGSLILNRENAWVFLPVLLMWLIWIGWQAQDKIQRWVAVPALVLGMSLVLVPVGLRNYYVGGEFLLTTSQMGPNFYIGNNAQAVGLYVPLRPDRGDARFEATDARLLAEQAEGRQLSPREVSQYWMRRSREDIMADPLRWIWLLGRKWFLTWNQVELVDGQGIRVHALYSPILTALRWFLDFGVVTAAAAGGVWLTRHRWRQLWAIHGLTISFALAVTLFFVFARYRFPLVPMVILFAAAALVGCLDMLRMDEERKWRELAVAGALALVVGIFSCWPQPKYHSDAVTYFSVATGLSDQERHEEAVEYFELAIKENPLLAPAYVNMSNALSAKQDWAGAERLLGRALEIQPDSAVTIAKLAHVQIEQGKLAKAEETLQRAMDIDPLSLETKRSLGRLELRKGNVDTAVAHFRGMLAIDGRSFEAHADLGIALMQQGAMHDAVRELEEAMQLKPGQILVANNLAWILSTGPDSVRDGKRAVQLADEVCQKTKNKVPEFLDTLAASHAAAGDFAKAVETMKQVKDILEEQSKQEDAEKARQRIVQYQQGQA
ncbi:MAG TPA: hypothetical protein DCF63_19705 [Planctomycetaceae bacterium]|nr:hypothetical protein [Planctomycetaceae bacterium]